VQTQPQPQKVGIGPATLSNGAAIETAMMETELPALVETRDQFLSLQALLRSVRDICVDRTGGERAANAAQRPFHQPLMNHHNDRDEHDDDLCGACWPASTAGAGMRSSRAPWPSAPLIAVAAGPRGK